MIVQQVGKQAARRSDHKAVAGETAVLRNHSIQQVITTMAKANLQVSLVVTKCLWPLSIILDMKCPLCDQVEVSSAAKFGNS